MYPFLNFYKYINAVRGSNKGLPPFTANTFMDYRIKSHNTKKLPSLISITNVLASYGCVRSHA